MIQISNLWKSYRVGSEVKHVAQGLDLDIPPKKAVGLFGRNGAGKSTLLRMIAGLEDPDHGQIRSDGTISWPVGFAGSFHGELTGAQNIRFVGRVYGVDTDELIHFVESFSELGPHFHARFRTYSSGMRARLAFGLSMGIRFDTYLIDEVTSVGDAAFRTKSMALLKARMADSGAVIVSHSLPMMQQICDMGVVLTEGHAHVFENVGKAIAFHEQVMKQPPVGG